MSNDGVGKFKQKRKNAASKPYARSQSFFGKVKETVKDILQPSWLGSIVSSFKPAASKSESAPNTPMPTQMRSDNQMSSSTPRRNAYPLNSLHQPSRLAPPPNMYSTVDGHMPFGAHSGQNQRSSNLHGYDNRPSMTDFSTSCGLTSTQTHMNKPDESPSLDDSRVQDEPSMQERPQEHEESKDHNTTDPDTSIASQSQRHESSSFFGKPSKRARTTGPQFNISLFTTPKRSSDNSMMFGSSFQQSPYYPGKTTYGGAASHRKSRLKASAAYQSNLSVKKITPRPLNKSSSGTVTSNTARKILDALESMPSVLHDAKRIPVNNSSLYDSPLSFTPSMYPRRRSLQPNTSRRDTPAGAPPTSRVNALGMASIAKNRQYLLPMREQTPVKAPAPVEEVKAASAPPVSQVETPHHSSGKMKRDKSHHYQALRDTEEDVIEVPNLPTNFVLPSDGFKLDIAVKIPQPKSKTPITTGQHPQFTFSSPIQKISSPVTASPGAPSGFQFSSPISIDEKRKDGNTVLNKPAMPDIAFGGSTGLKLKTKPPPKEVSPAGSFAPASELKQGSVMDFLKKGSAFKSSAPSVNKSATTNNTKAKDSITTVNSFLDKLKPAAGSWECSVCMINNKADNNNCIACMASKPAEKKESSQSSASVFKMLEARVAGSWDCPVCLINNKAESASCVACQARKPEPVSKRTASIMSGTSAGWNCTVCSLANNADTNSCISCTAHKPPKKTPAHKAVAPDKDFLAKLKPAEGSWSCPTCMVSNTSDASACVCCSTPNPKPKNSISSGSSVSANTNQPFLDKLKPPAGNWECPVCMISNTADAKSCLACSSAKPQQKSTQSPKQTDALAKLKMPADSWTCDTCLVPNSGTALKCIACETPKPGATRASGFAKPGGFQFNNPGSGVILDSKISSSALFSFGAASKSDSDSTSKTSMSSGGAFKFGAASDSSSTGGFKMPSFDSASTGGFKFGGETSEKKDSSASAVFAFGAKPSEAKTESRSDSTTGGFKFGGDSNKDSHFKIGQTNSDTKETKTIGGFAFNAGNSDSSKTSALAGVLSGSSKKDTASLGGGSTTTNTSSASGGFSFGGSTKRKANDDDDNKAKQTPSFQFGAPSLSKPEQVTDTKENGSIGGFAFKPISTSTSQKSSAGLGAGTADSKPFAFKAGQGSNTVQSLFGSESEPSAKRKPTDGLATSTIQTGVPSLLGFQTSIHGKPVLLSSDVPMSPADIGPQPPGSTGSSAPSFSFPAKPSSTPTFGQSNSSSSTPTFGQSTNALPDTSAVSFKFGATANPPVVSSTATYNFGQTTAATTSATTSGFAFSQPAASSAQPASTSSTFAFGQTASQISASSSTATTGVFTFGQGAKTATPAGTPASSGGFAFGQKASSTAPPATSASAFNFGATATTKAPSFGSFNANPAQPAAGPSFGAAAAAPAFGQQQSTASTPFGTQNTATPFGGPSTSTPFSQATPAFGATAPASAPAFGTTAAVPAFGATATKAPTAAPAFGAGFGTQATAAPAFGAPSTSANPSGFNFTQSAQSGSFNFGAQQSTAAPFQFGANMPSQVAPVASQPTAAAGYAFNATPSMNFGAAPTPATPQQQPFQFSGAPSMADANPFSVGATPASAIAGRKIKRATRKLKGR